MNLKTRELVGNILIVVNGAALIFFIVMGAYVFDEQCPNRDTSEPEVELAIKAEMFDERHLDVWINAIMPLHMSLNIVNLTKIDSKGKYSKSSIIELFPTDHATDGSGTFEFKIKIVEPSVMPNLKEKNHEVVPMLLIREEFLTPDIKALIKFAAFCLKWYAYIWFFALVIALIFMGIGIALMAIHTMRKNSIVQNFYNFSIENFKPKSSVMIQQQLMKLRPNPNISFKLPMQLPYYPAGKNKRVRIHEIRDDDASFETMNFEDEYSLPHVESISQHHKSESNISNKTTLKEEIPSSSKVKKIEKPRSSRHQFLEVPATATEDKTMHIVPQNQDKVPQELIITPEKPKEESSSQSQSQTVESVENDTEKEELKDAIMSSVQEILSALEKSKRKTAATMGKIRGAIMTSVEEILHDFSREENTTAASSELKISGPAPGTSSKNDQVSAANLLDQQDRKSETIDDIVNGIENMLDELDTENEPNEEKEEKTKTPSPSPDTYTNLEEEVVTLPETENTNMDEDYYMEEIVISDDEINEPGLTENETHSEREEDEQDDLDVVENEEISEITAQASNEMAEKESSNQPIENLNNSFEIDTDATKVAKKSRKTLKSKPTSAKF